jgi:hypothetical protein
MDGEPDTVNMPTGNSMWRLSNAISWVAGKSARAALFH